MAAKSEPTNEKIVRLLEAIHQRQERIARDVERLLKQRGV
jgi:hypothetical protein